MLCCDVNRLSRCHLALADELVSKAFQGRHGRAFLFGNVINVTLGPKEDRVLTTGLHTVADIFCLGCDESVGWFYVRCLIDRSGSDRVGCDLVSGSDSLCVGCWLVGSMMSGVDRKKRLNRVKNIRRENLLSKKRK